MIPWRETLEQAEADRAERFANSTAVRLAGVVVAACDATVYTEQVAAYLDLRRACARITDAELATLRELLAEANA